MTPLRLSLLLIVLLLSGCGFHLRGAEVLPQSMSQTAIVGGEGTELYFELENTLKNAGGEVVSAVGKETSLLTIQGQQFKRHVLSVDTQGRAAEYELVLQVSFALQTPNGHKLADNDPVTVTRDFSFDPNNVLAADDEEASLRREMIRQAVTQILRRVQILAKQAPGK